MTNQDLHPEPAFEGRDRLIADLREAVVPGSPPSVLAIFELAGAEEYRKLHGERSGAALNRHLAEEFAGIVGAAGRCYRTRQDELCVLFPRPLEAVTSILAAASIALRREGGMFNVTTSFGVALLPEEAAEPVAALIVADKNLAIARRTRQRRTGSREDDP
jgi:GGDEF domain-containing protein